MSNSLIKVRWEGNFSKKFDGKTNLVERKYVIHGAIEKGESIVVQQKKGGKTWKGVVLRTQSESSDDSDSDGSVEVPFFPKRGINEAGITPTRKDVKLKCLNYPRELKPRRLNKVKLSMFSFHISRKTEAKKNKQVFLRPLS